MTHGSAIDTTLLAIAVVVLVGVVAGHALRRFGQPAVVGEIIAGVLLGPSALGVLPGHLMARLFTTDAQHALSILGQVGLLVFMFALGATMEHEALSGRGAQVTAISLAGLLVPFGAGLLLAVAVHAWWPSGEEPSASLLAFTLFLGADMSVTAWPVLARLLADQRLDRTRLGSTCLAIAAVIDIAAWLLLVAVVAVVRSSGPGELLRLASSALGLVLLTRHLVRPLLRRALDRYAGGAVPPAAAAVMLAAILVMSWVTVAVGLHQIFGAFLLGLAMPRGRLHPVTVSVLERLQGVGTLLLPLFFVTVGLAVDVRALTPWALLVLVVVLVVGSTSKVASVGTAARLTGEPWRAAITMGTLMNTRGLTELAVLDVGFSLGVLSKEMFAVLIIASITGTSLTVPALRIIRLDPDAEALRPYGTGGAEGAGDERRDHEPDAAVIAGRMAS
ncbi:MAG: cation:proton antiporter [Frankiaceae bacterium]